MEAFILIVLIFVGLAGASSAASHYEDNAKKQDYSYKTYKPNLENLGTDKPIVDTYVTTVTIKKLEKVSK